jgi:hypothetical protein
MGGIVSWLTGSIGGLLGGGLSAILSKLTDNIIVLGLTVFALALGFFAITYLNRRRQMLNQEKMAALIKGLHYAGVPPEVFAKQKRKPDSRDHLMKGIRWLFGSAGLSGALYSYESLHQAADSTGPLSGALIGLIPGAMALAHFLCSWLCKRTEQSTAGSMTSRPAYRSASRPVYRTASRPVYRTAGRRF